MIISENTDTSRQDFLNKIRIIRQYNRMKQNTNKHQRNRSILKENGPNVSSRSIRSDLNSKNSQGYIVIDNFESSQDLSSNCYFNGTQGSVPLAFGKICTEEDDRSSTEYAAVQMVNMASDTSEDEIANQNGKSMMK